MRGTIDFTGPVRREFGPGGYLAAFRLEEVEQSGTELRVVFTAQTPFRGTFRLAMPVPAAVGDERWREVDDLTDDVAEWSRWGIAVPLLEAYETGALSAEADESGIRQLRLG